MSGDSSCCSCTIPWLQAWDRAKSKGSCAARIVAMTPRMCALPAALWLLLVTVPGVQAGEQVLNTRLSPRWAADGNTCWYRCQLGPRRYGFVLVDAVAGTRVAAFDHAAMAV